MTSIAQSADQDIRCDSYSKSRSRACLAFGRYACRNAHCAQRSCGLHVNRSPNDIRCPHCGGPVRTSKY